MKRKASAVWHGDLKSGKGTISTESGTLSQAQYSFSTRFENGVGTNPEELVAAAHAGCFTMALSFALSSAGHVPTSIETAATLTMENLPEKSWTITAIHLDTKASVPGIDSAAFAQLAAGAKANCPISRLLNTAITLDAKLA
jgi:osmotically inducible protein OsmC